MKTLKATLPIQLNHPCGVCGEPATVIVQPLEDTTPPGAEWRTVAASGDRRYFCAAHQMARLEEGGD